MLGRSSELSTIASADSSAQITRWTGTWSKLWANSSAPCSIRRRPAGSPLASPASRAARPPVCTM